MVGLHAVLSWFALASGGVGVRVGETVDGRARELVGATEDHRPLYVFPVGGRA